MLASQFWCQTSPIARGLQAKIEANMAYYVYRDVAGQWRWYLQAGNGRKLANSGEGYFNKSDCVSAIRLVANSGNTPIRDH